MNKYTDNLYSTLPANEIVPLYKAGWSMKRISKKYKVCSATILRVLRYAGVKTRKATYHLNGNKYNLQHFIIKEALKKQYIDERKSIVETAKEFGVSGGVIFYWLNRYNIPTHSFGELNIGKDRLSIEGRKRITQAISGKNNWNWKGGKIPKIYKRYTTPVWRSISLACKKRDNFICQRCKQKFPIFRLRAHHLIAIRKGGQDTLDNLITFCNSCHIHIENNYN